jgi:hypothetical protein
MINKLPTKMKKTCETEKRFLFWKYKKISHDWIYDIPTIKPKEERECRRCGKKQALWATYKDSHSGHYFEDWRNTN